MFHVVPGFVRNGTKSETPIIDLARRQHGLISHRQSLAVGITNEAIAVHVEHGQWVQIHRGIYVVGGAPDTYEQRLLARLLFCGPDAVASHRAAARLWGLPGFGELVEWSRPRGRSQRRAYGICHGSKWLPETHVATHDGIPVTTVARTMFDLAGIVHPRRVERVVDTAIARKLCRLEDLYTVFDDLARRGRRGTVVMRHILEARSPGYIPPNSEFEALGRRILADAGLGGFEAEVDLGGGEWVGRVDLVYRSAEVVVELDGRTYHQSLLDRDRDRQRDNALMAEGWRVIRLTWDDLRQRPSDVTERVRQACRNRSVA